MLDVTTSGTTRWLVGAASLFAVATGLSIVAYRDEQPAIKDSIVVIRSSQPISLAKPPVNIIDSRKGSDLAESLEDNFAFVKRGSTSCHGDTCIVSGALDMAKEMQSGDIKKFLDAGLLEYISNNGYVPLSDIDMLILSEDDIRFSLKYRAAIKQ